jgi:guanylate kinase
MEQEKVKVVTVGIIPFSEEYLEEESERTGVSNSEIMRIHSKRRLMNRGQDEPSKVNDRSNNALSEFKGALLSKYVIVNPHGEDDKEAWETRTEGVQVIINEFRSIVNRYKGHKVLLILNGPSCVGKGPLEKVFFEEICKEEGINAGKAVLYVDKDKRPKRKGESENNPYKFRGLAEINKLGLGERYLKYDVRGVTQLLDLWDIQELIQENDVVFLDIFYTAISMLRKLL